MTRRHPAKEPTLAGVAESTGRHRHRRHVQWSGRLDWPRAPGPHQPSQQRLARLLPPIATAPCLAPPARTPPGRACRCWPPCCSRLARRLPDPPWCRRKPAARPGRKTRSECPAQCVPPTRLWFPAAPRLPGPGQRQCLANTGEGVGGRDDNDGGGAGDNRVDAIHASFEQTPS